MKRSLSILLFAMSFFLLHSCGDCIKGSGSLKEETRTLKAFDELELNASANVVLRPVVGTDPLKIVVSAQENLLPFISTNVSGSTLKINYDECISATEKIVVTVDVRNLKKVSQNGSGDISSVGTIKAKELSVNQNGSGDAELDVDLDKLSISSRGSGDIKLSGHANLLEIGNKGSGNVESFSLKSNNVNVKNAGSGDIEINVREKLSARLTGSGDITYEGNPQTIDQKASGSGKISRKN